MQRKHAEKSKTIRDFGNQWQIHGELRQSFWTSDEMFRSHFPKNFDLKKLEGKEVLEIGSGSGRILHMISRYKPKNLTGVEPSIGFLNLVENTKSIPNLKLFNETGAEFKTHSLDYIFSIGVIHHIPDPNPVITNAFNSLKPGGALIVWVYGKENNRLYVTAQYLLRKVTKSLPDFIVDKISFFLSFIVDFYADIANLLSLNLPLTAYLTNVYGPCDRNEKKYIIFDQLNPDYAKYYRKQEVQELFIKAGFQNPQLYHRHGYSWTAIGIKPLDTSLR
jgi:SAM-dependent methyltransferase